MRKIESKNKETERESKLVLGITIIIRRNRIEIVSLLLRF